MTIRELYDKMTNVTLVNPSNFESHKMTMPDDTEITCIHVICTDKNGIKRMTLVKFDDVFGPMWIDPKNVDKSKNSVAFTINLTKCETVMDTREEKQ